MYHEIHPFPYRSSNNYYKEHRGEAHVTKEEDGAAAF